MYIVVSNGDNIHFYYPFPIVFSFILIKPIESLKILSIFYSTIQHYFGIKYYNSSVWLYLLLYFAALGTNLTWRKCLYLLNLTSNKSNIFYVYIKYITSGIIKLIVITSQFEHKRYTVISHVKLSVEFQVKADRKSSAYH